MSVFPFLSKPLPEWLWYEKSSLTREWTTTPLGHPHVPRLVDNHSDCYSKQLSGTIKEKRKLVLNDWTAEQWNVEKCEEIEACLLYLIQAGFEVFVWQNNEEDSFVKLSAEKINEGILKDVNFRKNITPITEQDLIEIFSKERGVSSDELGFLNCVCVKELLRHDGYIEGPLYYVLGSEIQKSIFSLLKLESVIKRDHNNLIFPDVWYELGSPENKFVSSLRNQFGIVSKIPTHFIMNVEDDYSKTRRFILGRMFYSLLLKGSGQILEKNADIVQKLFLEANNLKSLIINNVPDLKLNIKEHVLDNLQKFVIFDNKGDSETFVSQVLNKAPSISYLALMFSQFEHFGFSRMDLVMSQVLIKLKHLRMNCSRDFKPHYIPSMFLKNIESLYLGKEIDMLMLNYILKEANVLHELVVAKLVDTGGIKVFSLMPLNYLKTLKMERVTCPLNLKQAVALEDLSISYEVLGDYKLELNNESMYRLKKFSLDKCCLNNDEFQTMIINLPNLEFLRLREVSVKKGNAPSFPKGCLNKLKKLYFGTVEMDAALLKNILGLSYALQVLELRGFINYNTLDVELKINLPDLEELTVDSRQFTWFSDNKKIKTLHLLGFISSTTWEGVVNAKLTSVNTSKGLTFVPNKESFPIAFLNNVQIFEIYGAENFPEDIVRHIILHAKNLNRGSMDYWDGVLDKILNKNLSSLSPFSSIVRGNNQARTRVTLDMNTKSDPNIKYDLIKVFWGVHTADPFPAHYRISAYDTIEIERNIKLTNQYSERNEFSLGLIGLQHTPYFCEQDTFSLSNKIPLKENEQCFYGKTTLLLSEHWQPLPSLSTREAITHLHIPGINKADIDLQYSTRDRLYYIRITNPSVRMPKPISVDFLLKTPWPILRTGVNCVNSSLRKLASKYQKNLGDIGLPPSATEDASGYRTETEILQALQAQTLVGACRHRSLAFKAEADRLIREGALLANTCVRIIENDCHMFVEVEEESEEEIKGLRESITIDLGGHPAAIQLSNENAPVGISTSPETATLSAHTADVSSLPDTPEQHQLKSILRSRFNTWTPHISQAVNLNTYAHLVLTGFSEQDPTTQVKNALVSLDSKEAVENMRLYLQMTCQGHQDKEIYYIDSPEDLICSSNWIERVGNKGMPREGPGGPLHAFLTKEDFSGENKKTPIILVNWNNFKPSDVIKFNALYDTKERKADGTLLPEHTRVIGLYNTNNPKAYKGNDFFRRWVQNLLSKSLLEALPHAKEIQSYKAFFKVKPEGLPLETVIIDLYESSDWKEILLGRWVLQGKALMFEEGKLKASIKKSRAENKPLEIKNGLWNNEIFKTFWQQEKLAGRLNDLNLVYSQGYDWVNVCQPKDTGTKILCERVETAPLDKEVYILNPTVFSKFLYDYTFKPSDLGTEEHEGVKGDLFKIPGWLQTHASDETEKTKPMLLYVTRALSTHQWAELLEAAKDYKVSLDIKLAPNVFVPTDLQTMFNAVNNEIKDNLDQDAVRMHVRNDSDQQSKIYITSDIAYTVSKLKTQEENVNCKVINVSELESQELWEQLNAKMEGLQYSFIKSKNALLMALQAGDTVILKGKFKSELIDELASLCMPNAYAWLDGEKVVLPSQLMPGKLILVSEDENKFDFIPVNKENEQAILAYKSNLIQEIQAEIKELSEAVEEQKRKDWLSTRTVVQLNSILSYVKSTGSDPRLNWEGLAHISEYNKNNIGQSVKIDLSLESSEDFKYARYTQIDDVLRGKRSNPFVFVAGSTGVGKSSFVQKELEKIPGSPYKVYVGFKKIQEWVDNTQHAEYPVLFIDEANIDSGNFSNYEGLFDKPPHMIINGKYITLTDKHKVIFAGNPLSYGSRKIPTLFNDYGGAIVFPPMSPAYLYHQILNPIFSSNIGAEGENKPLPEDMNSEYSYMILSLYQQIVSMSEDGILMSPRELQMMALLMMTKYKNTGKLSQQSVLKIMKDIAEPLVPKRYKDNFETFCLDHWGELDMVVQEERIIPATTTTDAFLVTGSRRSIDNEINDFLSVRQLKWETTEHALKYAAGLGGIVLEGEPGVGKSEFVINVLVEKGFKEKSISSTVISDEIPKNYFYKMPVSMQASDKEKLLLRAFHEGSVVVIDEINSSPMMETLLNALLMGYDLEGNRAKIPGFMIIATQNPVSMAGREAASSAVEHRFIKRIFTPYTDLEMINIVQERGLLLKESAEIVKDYSKARQYAQEHHKEPAPTFGHVMTVVKSKLEAEKRAKKIVFYAAAEESARIAAERAKAEELKKQSGGDNKVIFGKSEDRTKDSMMHSKNNLSPKA